MRPFSIWYDEGEEWDESYLSNPDFKCVAASFVEAAESIVESYRVRHGQFIVRDNQNASFREIKLVRNWTLESESPTTLAELTGKANP